MVSRPNTPSQQWTNLKLLNWAAEYLASHHIDSPRATAEILLSHVLDGQRIDLYVHHDRPLDKSELAAFKVFIKRRVKREPVAYITGQKSFWTLDLTVTPDVLIPRPETEILVEAALELIPEATGRKTDRLRILDLGTGTGAIALSLAAERPGHLVLASDVSAAALRVASANALASGLAGAVHFFVSDWLLSISPTSRPFDLIISNPPYIRKKDIAQLEPEICRHEPALALDGGVDGLDCLKTILNEAHRYLAPQGRLLMEIGFDQKNDVMRIIDRCGVYGNVAFIKDYGGHNRVVQVQKK